MPFAAACHSHSFASTGWGAWSVATMSMVPSARASRSASHVLVAAQRRVHLEPGVVARDEVLGEQQVVRA